MEMNVIGDAGVCSTDLRAIVLSISYKGIAAL